jgi:hypothetical protein
MCCFRGVMLALYKQSSFQNWGRTDLFSEVLRYPLFAQSILPVKCGWYLLKLKVCFFFSFSIGTCDS